MRLQVHAILQSVPRRDDDQKYLNNQSMVESYLISGDRVLLELKLGQAQIGRVMTYNPETSFFSFDAWQLRHTIDEIQVSICDCLQSKGSVSIQEVSESCTLDASDS